LENNVTAFLVRSLASGWTKGSVVAVDAGVHLSAIVKILEETQPQQLGEADGPSLPHVLTTGPFAGLEVCNASAEANAAHIHRDLIDGYLITHPHLDHIAGFVINTAGLPGARPKKLAGLPTTVNAFKNHIFNNIIWPNLSDENNGAGLVTYMRLVEGGSPALGKGEGKGYLEVCDGLAVKVWSVSHGHCIERHSHRGSSGSVRHGSFDASSAGIGGDPRAILTPARGVSHHHSMPPNLGAFLQDRMQGGQGGILSGGQTSRRGSGFSGVQAPDESVCVYDSSAYFIRDVTTGREILIFGDVEPDSVSLSPRNRQVWQEAGPKIAAGKLVAIFIECSYDDSQCVDRLFGHLTPRYIIEELTALAEEVVAARQVTAEQTEKPSAAAAGDNKKRKRADTGDDNNNGGLALPKRRPTPQPKEREPRGRRSDDHPISPKSLHPKQRVSSSSSSHGRDTTTTTTTTLSQSHSHSHSHSTSPPTSVPMPMPLPIYPPPSGSPSGSNPPTSIAESDPQQHPEEGEESGRGLSLSQSQHDDDMMTSPTTPLSTNLSSFTHPNPPPLVSSLHNALEGLKVVIIHVKEKLDGGGTPPAGEVILEELGRHEKEGVGLGCEFVLSRAGEDLIL
jgi:3',5'-cyclic-nucleotide phosphodiesterase